ncbi:MAG: DUF6261 family protein [Tannerella sp.]|jgi:hypothetical protein|nr:DUF6261 family protein [Tannerella sp.]
MVKFHSLYTHRLSILDLAGLSTETIIAGKAAGSDALGTLGTAAFNALIAADSAFSAKLVTAKSSTLTKQIHDLDVTRDTDLQEIHRTATAASKGSNADRAAAGEKLLAFLKPYHDATDKALMSETAVLNYMHIQYNADPLLLDAAVLLYLDSVFAGLFTANEQLSDLWNERADNDADQSGPSPTSLRRELEKCYDAFCDVTVQNLRLLPTPTREHLFQVMNEIRIKYSRSLPVRLTNANTSVEAIPPQVYTGKPLTPVPPHVFIKTDDDGEFRELLFSVDYFVTYRNNTDVGEARILIHGKGHYTGLYTSTFHIVKAHNI